MDTVKEIVKPTRPERSQKLLCRDPERRNSGCSLRAVPLMRVDIDRHNEQRTDRTKRYEAVEGRRESRIVVCDTLDAAV